LGAFSLVELVIVLALMVALACVSTVEFRFSPGNRDEISEINRAMRCARQISISTNQSIFLSHKLGKFLILDAFGEEICGLKCKSENFAPISWKTHGAKFDKFGFFEPFAIEYDNIKYAANELSGMLHEKTK
jgi:hypothetical protein